MKYLFFVAIVLTILFFHSGSECQQLLPVKNCIKIHRLYFSDTLKIRFDGFYNTYDTSLNNNGCNRNDVYTSDHLVIFTKEDRIFRMDGVSIDSIVFTEDYYRNLKPKNIGNYWINGDSIFALVPTALFVRGGRLKLFNAYFSGVIKNKDTLINWKMIPPYPDVKPKWNQYFVSDTTPRMLYFIKTESVRYLDSIISSKL